MHIILTGATGLVGSGVLDAMIRAPDITRISILSRRPVQMADDAKDARIKVILHDDFSKITPSVLDQLKGASGCVWALGISQTKVSKEEYVTITKTYALEAAKAFSTLATTKEDPFRFVYVSGEGTTQTPGAFTPYFAQVKGETEKLLGDMTAATPTLHVDSVRPGFVDPYRHEAVKRYAPNLGAAVNGMMALLGPPLRTLYRSGHSPTAELGEFLTGMAMGKYDGRVEGPGAFRLGGSWVVGNAGFRRIYGL